VNVQGSTEDLFSSLAFDEHPTDIMIPVLTNRTSFTNLSE